MIYYEKNGGGFMDDYDYRHDGSAPLDNDALTQMVYNHDDAIVELFNYIRRLEQRIEELEKQNQNL